LTYTTKFQQVPNSPERAAEAAAESVAAAMRKSHNVLMIDLRISSYVITEGNEYDKKAMYDFCTNLTTELRARKLITKSLILVRNEKERVDTERAIADARNAATVVPNEEEEVAKESDDIAEFRKKLISSWDSPANPESNAQSESSDQSANLGSSHRLWSMVADEKISSGPNMFDEVIAAVDKHARLRVEKHEDALIIVSPYDTADTIAIRRILARYGQTRTIIIVNSHMEELPTEMDNAVLVYGMMPLEARPLSGTKYENEDESSFKVVIMRRFPKDWSIFVDNNDSGFVQANGSMYDQPRADSKEFPSPEWVRRTIQDYVDDLSQ